MKSVFCAGAGIQNVLFFLNDGCLSLPLYDNLVLAVNTSDFPGNEVRMWYNPDLMENRQRAVFMAGCDVLDETLMTYAYNPA